MLITFIWEVISASLPCFLLDAPQELCNGRKVCEEETAVAKKKKGICAPKLPPEELDPGVQ